MKRKCNGDQKKIAEEKRKNNRKAQIKHAKIGLRRSDEIGVRRNKFSQMGRKRRKKDRLEEKKERREKGRVGIIHRF